MSITIAKAQDAKFDTLIREAQIRLMSKRDALATARADLGAPRAKTKGGASYVLVEEGVVSTKINRARAMLSAVRSMTFSGTMAAIALPYAGDDLSSDWQRVGADLRRAVDLTEAGRSSDVRRD